MKFSKIYAFLLENDFIKHICYIEEDIEGILSIIYEFCNPNTGYYNPLCDEAIAQLKDAIDNDILTTAWGKEYRRNGIIEKNIMDGYDAGWLSPNGIFYAENGPDGNMMHMYIAIQLFIGMLNTAMVKDGVKESSGNYLPEQWLERHGWMKIHRDEIYGYFYGEKKDDKEWPYCPTEKQIKAICDYVDKYYNGKFYMTPKIVEKTAPLTFDKWMKLCCMINLTDKRKRMIVFTNHPLLFTNHLHLFSYKDLILLQIVYHLYNIPNGTLYNPNIRISLVLCSLHLP